MFHYSRCVSPRAINQPLPLAITEDWELQVQPEAIIAVRINEAGQEEVLMKWANLSEFENSWELKSNIQREFLDFHLEDKVDLQGGGIDSDPRFGKVYSRQKKRGHGLSLGPLGG